MKERCPYCNSILKKACIVLNETTEEPERRFGYGISCPKGEAGLCDYKYWQRPLTDKEIEIWD